MGLYRLGDRNERGDVLMERCEEKELMITNNWFKQLKKVAYLHGKAQTNKQETNSTTFL